MNTPRMDSLYSAMRQEEQRLQDASALVSRIAAGLDMDVSARAGIDAALDSIRRQLEQQAEHMARMQMLARTAAAGIAEQDEKLAGEARGLHYNMNQFLSGASAAGFGGMMAGALPHGLLSPTVPPWSLGAQEGASMAGSLVGLLGGNGSGLLEQTGGVSLGTLLANQLVRPEPHLSDADWQQCTQNAAFAALGALGGIGVAGGASFFSNTAVGATMGNKKPLKTDTTTKKKSGKKTSNPTTSSNFWQQGVNTILSAKEKVEKKVESARKKVEDTFEDFEEHIYETAEKNPFVGYWYNGTMATVSLVTHDSEGILKYGKKILAQKPVQCLIDAGGDILSMGGDLLGYAENVVTGDMLGAASDMYGFCNSTINLYQDLEAGFSYWAGDLFTALGNEDEAANWYTDAAAANDADGIAGGFDLGGNEILGGVAEVVDTANDLYKIGDGFKSLWESGGKILDKLGNKELGEAGKKLFELSGWKIPQGMDGITTAEAFETLSEAEQVKQITQKLKTYKALFSDGKLALKYEEAIEDGELLETVWENSAIGKPISKLWNFFEDLIEDVDAPTIDNAGGGGGGGGESF